MHRLIAVLGLLLLSACISKSLVMPDGTPAHVYPVEEVLTWPIVDGARQSPIGVRIYVDPTVKFNDGVLLGEGVKIGANSYLDEDVVLFPNVIVGEGVEFGDDTIVESDVRIGDRVYIRGESRIGAGSVIHEGAKVPKYKSLPPGSVFGAEK